MIFDLCLSSSPVRSVTPGFPMLLLPILVRLSLCLSLSLPVSGSTLPCFILCLSTNVHTVLSTSFVRSVSSSLSACLSKFSLSLCVFSICPLAFSVCLCLCLSVCLSLSVSLCLSLSLFFALHLLFPHQRQVFLCIVSVNSYGKFHIILFLF